MIQLRQQIDLDAPPDAVYAAWLQFERFPEFMEGVREVRVVGDELHWRAEFGGRSVEWTSAITVQIPCHRIAWRVLAGTTASGAVTIGKADEGRTRVTMEMRYDPAGPWGEAAVLERRIAGDLARFRALIETRVRFPAAP